VRRQFNLAFFDRLLIDEEYKVRGELAKPFDAILGDELRRAAIAKADEDTRTAVEEALQEQREQIEAINEQRPHEPERVLVGADSTPAISEVVGWNANNMVELVGIEPTTFWLPARRSPS
jgi:hypothetical protein